MNDRTPMNPTDDSLDLGELRRVMPEQDDDDAVDALLGALAHNRFRAAAFGVSEDVTLDRYIIRRELGRGGMGVVFEAFDPILMIPVALKVLGRGGRGSASSDASRQKEAQALAAVQGDHVVRVYSAGFHRGQAWIAMQFVPGLSLAEWLRVQRGQGKLGWRDVLGKFVDAARGLVAIHQAGLIHRDFKPQNAVVDPRGRVRVLDFGLATRDRRPVDGGSEPHFHNDGTTSTNALVGTLRYASPEQFGGNDLDHRSDQFSFCVALWEALWARTPLGDAVSTGQRLAIDPDAVIPRPGTSDVPGWLTNVVLRGLRARPEHRYPDMTALLFELTRDRRRAIRIGGLLAAGLVGGGLAVAVATRPPDALAICLSGQAEIAAVIGEGPAFDRHVAAWRDAHAVACADTYQGNVPDTLLARRQACLRADRATLAAIVARAPVADRERLISELGPPANCLDEGLGRIPAPRDRVTQERVTRVDNLLAEVHAGRVLGDYAGAADTARAAVVAAEAAAHRPALARARYALGSLERRRGHHAAAEATLLAAVADAGISGDLALQVGALHELVRLALLGERAAENGAPYLRLAAHVLPEIHPESSAHDTASAAVQALRAEHADMQGLLAFADARIPDALTHHGDAIDRWLQLGERTDVRGELAASLLNRANARAEAGDHAAARDDRSEALRLEIDRFGAGHPSLAANHRGLVHDHLALADYPAAEREARRALAIDTAHNAATGVAQDHQLLVKLALDTGELDAAAEHAAAMLASVAANPDATPELRADAEFAAASVATMREDPTAAAQWARVAAALAEVSGPWAACQRAHAEFNRAQLAHDAGDRATFSDAVSRIDAVVPALGDLRCQALAESLWLQGEDLRLRGDLARAVSLFEAAVLRSDPAENNHADLLDALARTLHALGREPDRVQRLGAEAMRAYTERDHHEAANSLRELLARPSTPSR